MDWLTLHNSHMQPTQAMHQQDLLNSQAYHAQAMHQQDLHNFLSGEMDRINGCHTLSSEDVLHKNAGQQLGTQFLPNQQRMSSLDAQYTSAEPGCSMDRVAGRQAAAVHPTARANDMNAAEEGSSDPSDFLASFPAHHFSAPDAGSGESDSPASAAHLMPLAPGGQSHQQHHMPSMNGPSAPTQATATATAPHHLNPGCHAPTQAAATPQPVNTVLPPLPPSTAALEGQGQNAAALWAPQLQPACAAWPPCNVAANCDRNVSPQEQCSCESDADAATEDSSSRSTSAHTFKKSVATKRRGVHSSKQDQTAEGSGERPDGPSSSGKQQQLLPHSSKKQRLVWSPELHNRFALAVMHLGVNNAVPKNILQMMDVDGMTRENVASHLQKFRQQLKRIAGVANNQPIPAQLEATVQQQALALQQQGSALRQTRNFPIPAIQGGLNGQAQQPLVGGVAASMLQPAASGLLGLDNLARMGAALQLQQQAGIAGGASPLPSGAAALGLAGMQTSATPLSLLGLHPGGLTPAVSPSAMGLMPNAAALTAGTGGVSHAALGLMSGGPSSTSALNLMALQAHLHPATIPGLAPGVALGTAAALTAAPAQQVNPGAYAALNAMNATAQQQGVSAAVPLSLGSYAAVRMPGLAPGPQQQAVTALPFGGVATYAARSPANLGLSPAGQLTVGALAAAAMPLSTSAPCSELDPASLSSLLDGTDSYAMPFSSAGSYGGTGNPQSLYGLTSSSDPGLATSLAMSVAVPFSSGLMHHGSPVKAQDRSMLQSNALGCAAQQFTGSSWYHTGTGSETGAAACVQPVSAGYGRQNLAGNAGQPPRPFATDVEVAAGGVAGSPGNFGTMGGAAAYAGVSPQLAAQLAFMQQQQQLAALMNQMAPHGGAGAPSTLAVEPSWAAAAMPNMSSVWGSPC